MVVVVPSAVAIRDMDAGAATSESFIKRCVTPALSLWQSRWAFVQDLGTPAHLRLEPS